MYEFEVDDTFSKAIPFQKQIEHLHTKEELERVSTLVENATRLKSEEEVTGHAFEFLSSSGRQYFDISLLNIRNTHLVALFKKVFPSSKPYEYSPSSISDPLPYKFAAGWESWERDS
jgi:hypothetical protein